MPALAASFGNSRLTYDGSIGSPAVRPFAPDATEQKTGCLPFRPSVARLSSQADSRTEARCVMRR